MVFVGAPLPARPALRLTMVTERAHHGALQGAWWPRGRDLAVELPALVAGLDAWLDAPVPGHGEHVTRLLMRLTGWDAVPARVDIAGRRVRMSWSGAVDPHSVSVTSSAGTHLDLMIIPQDAPARLAGTAAGRAIDPTNTLNPTALLARAMPAFVHDAHPEDPWAAPAGAWPHARGALRLLDDGDPDDAPEADMDDGGLGDGDQDDGDPDNSNEIGVAPLIRFRRGDRGPMPRRPRSR